MSFFSLLDAAGDIFYIYINDDLYLRNKTPVPVFYRGNKIWV